MKKLILLLCAVFLFFGCSRETTTKTYKIVSSYSHTDAGLRSSILNIISRSENYSQVFSEAEEFFTNMNGEPHTLRIYIYQDESSLQAGSYLDFKDYDYK